MPVCQLCGYSSSVVQLEKADNLKKISTSPYVFYHSRRRWRKALYDDLLTPSRCFQLCCQEMTDEMILIPGLYQATVYHSLEKGCFYGIFSGEDNC
ncbi:hypothetical protein RRG08_025834 [Elysia crispata]|uniref:Uncharacterized protein n=1 Tax=Elysia crispata TaxID=231223 RepID=A0AAE1CRV3_9GAST|nr:hypothetical protein RRG08_025834 [Elysia crispata]